MKCEGEKSYEKNLVLSETGFTVEISFTVQDREQTAFYCLAHVVWKMFSDQRYEGVVMKKILFLILILAMVVIVPVFSQDTPGYTKMTHPEVETWLDSITWPTFLDYVADADYAQHAAPEVSLPSADYILSEDGTLLVQYNGPVTIRADNFLTYTITLPDSEIKGFYQVPQLDFWNGLIGGLLAGIVLGGVASALIF